MKIITKIQNKAQKGFTLVEVLLVLAFAAVLVAAAFIAYQQVISSSNTNEAVQNAATISAGTRGLYSNQASYANLTNDVLVSARIAPESVVEGGYNGYSSGSALNSVLGDNATLVVESADSDGTANAASGRFIAMRYANVPTEQCLKFVSSLAPSFTSILVGGNAVKPVGGSYDVATATTECESANTITLIGR